MAFEADYTAMKCCACLLSYRAILRCDDPGHRRCPLCKSTLVTPEYPIRSGDLRIEREVEALIARNRTTTRREPPPCC